MNRVAAGQASAAGVAGAPTAARPPFELEPPDLRRWRSGNTGVEGVWRFEADHPGRDVLVTALVHGNELCGALALYAALEHGLRPRRGALTLAFANLRAFDRFDTACPDAARFIDQDMNRLWGPMPWRATAHLNREQRRVLELAPVVERSEWLLDLHSMHEPGPALGLVGPLAHHAAQALRIGGVPWLVADRGHRAGCRMRDHGAYAEPGAEDRFALLVECGYHGARASLATALDLLGRFCVASGCIDESDLPPAWRLPPAAPPRLLAVTESVTVGPGEPPRFERPWQCGERVPEAGTLLAWTGGKPVRTPYDDCVLVMPTLVHATPGATLLRLARELAHPLPFA